MALLLLTGSMYAEPLHPDERDYFRTPIMLTNPDRFVKAGEAYFDSATKRVIFQAVEQDNSDESDYSIFIGDLLFNHNNSIVELINIKKLSNDGSANTCAWFHPNDQGTVLFATTDTPVTHGDSPGYQRGTDRYKWAFPQSMNIVSYDLATNQMVSLINDPSNYIAEGSWSPDGRHLLYCSLATGGGDIYVTDLKTRQKSILVDKAGYDGGPFFSPDGKRIVYRSDRRENDLLQLFVAELKFDEHGSIIGIDREYQLTDNPHVNWGPFWHPNGRFLIYATSEIGHHNYELFICDADNGDKSGTTRYGTRKRRITHAEEFDGLPVFDNSGKWLMWTSKRETGTSQLWVAPFIFNLDAEPTNSGQ
ncbi:MAG: hypothetical protein VX436_00730 [Planctomycetota bacterium]|nr:hypothetical protein [Planctomycetota bacterium]